MYLPLQKQVFGRAERSEGAPLRALVLIQHPSESGSGVSGDDFRPFLRVSVYRRHELVEFGENAEPILHSGWDSEWDFDTGATFHLPPQPSADPSPAIQPPAPAAQPPAKKRKSRATGSTRAHPVSRL